MANCIQNFSSLFRSKASKEKFFGGVFSSEEFLNSDLNSEIWNNKQNEIIELLSNVDNIGIQGFDFKTLETSLQNLVTSEYDKLPEDSYWRTEEQVEKISDFINEIVSTLKNKYISENKVETNPTLNGNSLYDFSKISKVLYELDSFEKYLKTIINSGLFKTIFINIFNDGSNKYKYEKFVVSDVQLNKNIAIFKNELWDNIVEYYIKTKIKSKEDIWKLSDISLYKIITKEDGEIALELNSELFNVQSVSGKSFYSEVMDFVKSQMNNLISANGDIAIFDGNKITTSQAYVKSLVLANFDNFILDYHSDKVSVNLDGVNSFGIPVNDKMKYKLNLKWVNSKSFGDETSSDIENHTTSLIKMVSSVIPFYEKITTRSGEKWIPNFQNNGVGKDNIDAIGAIINDINPNLKIEFNGENKSIGELFLLMDENKITFKEILDLLIGESATENKETKVSATDKNNTLYEKRDVLISIKEFLYGRNGLSNAIKTWRNENIQYADYIINPEQALINHIRTSVKNIYFTTQTNEVKNAKSTSLDVLDLDSKVKYDYDNLVTNLVKNWKLNKIKFSDWESITSFDSFIKFLNNPNGGGLDISNRVIENFKETEEGKKFKDPEYFKSSLFKKHIITLFKHPSIYSEELEQIINLPFNDVVDLLRNEETNDILRLTELFKQTHRESKHNIPRMIKNFEGASMPTMGVSNLATLFSIAVNKTDNFFKQNPGFYKRTQILLDVKGENSGKDVSDLNGNELFNLQFTRGYLESMIVNSEASILPWNFSDKPKIYNIVVSANTSIKVDKDINKTLKELNSEDLKKLMFDNQWNYYKTLLNDIYEDFSKLDSEYFNEKLTGLKKIAKIESYLEKINTEAKQLKIKPSEHFSNIINEHFNSKKEYVEFSEDLHYSMYNGELKFNQLLKAYTELYSKQSVFEQWVESREEALIKNLNVEYIPFSQILVGQGISFNTAKIKKIEDTFGLKPEYEIGENGIKLGIKLIKDGKLTEIAKRFLWTKNFVISQYANTTVKDAFLHPFKGNFEEINVFSKEKVLDSSKLKWIERLEIEENKRAIAFTKRMNVPGASIGIYGKGKEGIDLKIKIAAMTDPSSETFNYTGTIHKQDTFDGGAQMSPILNELMKNSLPGNSLQSSQKPLAESITSKTSTTLKFATFAYSNEEIRNSEFSNRKGYTIMKKMHDFDIWEDNEFTNLFEFKNDLGYPESLDISKIFPNFAIPYNGVYREINTIKYNGENSYTINFKGRDNASKEVKINTLFDMWEAFGGAYSGKLENGKLEENEYSIELVSTIIKKHALYTPNLKLKDKMIGMLVPKSAVKKGVSNLNNESDVFSDNNRKLSYFNFDTSFFGVQLDAYHSTEDSQTNEITQVISAITENNTNPKFYNLIYNSIGEIIKKGLEKFQLQVNSEENFNKIITDFIDKLNNSSQINNARAIINGISDNLESIIPLDNKTIYKQFVSHIIAKINTDFIRRLFPGSSSVLRPSQGYIMIFEDNKERKYLVPDLLKKFDLLVKESPELYEMYVSTLQLGSSERDNILNKVRFVLNNDLDFKPVEIDISEIRPLDKIKISKSIFDENGKVILSKDLIIDLSKIEEYFKVKEILKSVNDPELKIERIFSEARDLKPEDVTFSQQVLTGELDVNGELILDSKGNPLTKTIERSLYDLESVEFKYFIESFAKKDKTPLFNNFKYIKFIEYLIKINPKLAELNDEELYKEASKYSQLWVKRSMDLIAQGKIFKTFQGSFEEIFDSSIGLDNFNSKLNFEYKNYDIIYNYRHRRPENIHTNVFKNNFGVEDKSFFEITDKSFAVKNKPSLKKTPFDLVLFNTLDNSQLNIILGNRNYLTVNGKLYERKKLEENASYEKISLEEAALKTEEVAIKSNKVLIKTEDNGDVFRITEYGKKLYKLPKNYEIFEVNNSEILVIKDDENTKLNMMMKSLNQYVSKIDLGVSKETRIDFEEFMKSYSNYDSVYVKELGYKTYDKLLSEEDEFVEFLDLVENNIYDKDLSRYLRIKRDTYKKFKESVKPIDESQTRDKNWLRDEYEKFRKSDEWKDIAGNYFKKLKSKRLASFRKSIESISARIPAQGMQSFMSMDTVGFIKGDANDVYVSHWQLFLQGSDYDIDKLYMMMYGFKNGIFEAWSPQFDLKEFEKSKNIPLPTGKRYININSTKNVIKYNETQEDGTTIEVEEEIKIDNSKLFNIDAELQKENLQNVKFLDKFIYIMNKINSGDYKYLYTDDSALFNAIKKHEKFYSEAGFKNFILSNLINVADSPTSRIAAMSPISFGIYSDYQKQENSYRLSLYDGFTMGLQQEQNSVGKAVIGVAATGLKNYFGLIKYFSDYFNNIKLGQKISPKDNQFFMKIYDINGKQYLIKKISGLDLDSVSLSKQQNILKEELYKQLEAFITDENRQEFENKLNDLTSNEVDVDVALTISSILSLATDNAKELVLAKINAGVEFAGMHIYMIMMGIDPENITKFMTSNVGLKAKNLIKSNIFQSSYKKSVQNEVSSLPSAFTDKEDIKAAETFKQIYNDSQELTTLGRLFKANQGSKASQEELFGILGNLEISIIMRAKVFESSMRQKLGKSAEEKSLSDLIKIDKPYLEIEDIQKIVIEAERYGIHKNKLNLMTYYNDDNYRKAAIDYYNLIKGSINILDVLDKLPHFNNMFKSFVIGREVLINKTNKLNFISKLDSVTDSIIQNPKFGSVENYSILKSLKLSGNKDNPSFIDKEIMSTLNDYYDNRVILSFFQQLGKSMNLISLLDYLGIDSIRLLKNDKQNIEFEDYTREQLLSLQKDKFNLGTQFGIAQFRYIMESYIIPHLKESHKSNGFLKNYTFGSYQSYNLKKQMSYYLDESNFKDLEELEKGMSELVGRNFSNEVEEEERMIRNSFNVNILDVNGRTEPTKAIDLLTLYNLIVNEGRFGGNRASNLFYKDLDNLNSMSRKFIDFERNLTSEFVDELILKLTNSTNDQEIFLLNVFGSQDITSTDKEVVLSLGKSPDRPGYEIKVNRYFTHLEDASGTSIYKTNEDIGEDLSKEFKLNNTEIIKKCK